MEVYVDSEKLNSNVTDKLSMGQFQRLPTHEDPYEAQQMITMKTDINSNDCQWKHMGKNITDYIKTQPVLERHPDCKPLSELSIDEITEFSICDATSREGRRELLAKKLRRVYSNTPITVKVVFKNELGMSMHL